MKNVVVAQSGGPTAVINSSLAGVIRGFKGKAGTVYGSIHGIEGVLHDNLINLSETFAKEEDLELLSRTPAAYLGTCRHRLVADDMAVFEKIFKMFAKYDVGYFLYIGGNDSMDTVAKLSKYAAEIGSDIRFVGVPKTIDNDLAETDHTPGYGSAAKYVATSMREIILDSIVYDIKTLTIVEIMGRNAGWLTAAAALARNEKIIAPHYIYMPEVVFDLEKFMADVGEAIEKHRNVIVAVSEGIKLANGKYVFEMESDSTPRDAFGHAQLSGTAAALSHMVKERIKGVKVRAIEFSLLQRSAAHIASQTDVTEAGLIGEAGAAAALAGETGIMMSFERVSSSPYKMEICKKDVNLIANAEKKVPKEWINADGNDIKSELIEYMRPLIIGESKVRFENGLPVYAVREK